MTVDHIIEAVADRAGLWAGARMPIDRYRTDKAQVEAQVAQWTRAKAAGVLIDGVDDADRMRLVATCDPTRRYAEPGPVLTPDEAVDPAIYSAPLQVLCRANDLELPPLTERDVDIANRIGVVRALLATDVTFSRDRLLAAIRWESTLAALHRIEAVLPLDSFDPAISPVAPLGLERWAPAVQALVPMGVWLSLPHTSEETASWTHRLISAITQIHPLWQKHIADPRPHLGRHEGLRTTQAGYGLGWQPPGTDPIEALADREARAAADAIWHDFTPDMCFSPSAMLGG